MQIAQFKNDLKMFDHGEFEVWRIRGNPDTALLSPEELERLHAIRDPQTRQTFLLSRSAIREIVKSYKVCSASEIRLKTLPGGKPVLVNNPDLHFSLSHTRGEVAIAFSGSPVGLDMENPARRADFNAMAGRFFSTKECEQILRAGLDGMSCFLELWTAKESMLKLEGTGISGGLERALVLNEGEGDLDGRRVYLHRLEWPDVIAKIASYHRPIDVRVRELVF